MLSKSTLQGTTDTECLFQSFLSSMPPLVFDLPVCDIGFAVLPKWKIHKAPLETTRLIVLSEYISLTGFLGTKLWRDAFLGGRKETNIMVFHKCPPYCTITPALQGLTNIMFAKAGMIIHSILIHCDMDKMMDWKIKSLFKIAW